MFVQNMFICLYRSVVCLYVTFCTVLCLYTSCKYITSLCLCLFVHTISCYVCLSVQNEDLAALAAQQYYVELGDQMNPERLTRMIPSVIPDSFLAGPGAQDKWLQMIMASFSRVSRDSSIHSKRVA